MNLKNGTIIKLGNLVTSAEIKFVDDTTKKTLDWFINACLEAEVDLDNSAEIVAFCSYLIICLSKTKLFLEHINNKDMQLLEIYKQLSEGVQN